MCYHSFDITKLNAKVIHSQLFIKRKKNDNVTKKTERFSKTHLCLNGLVAVVLVFLIYNSTTSLALTPNIWTYLLANLVTLSLHTTF